MGALNALLLMGGRSSRMGQDKAHLRQSGVPLWQVQLKKLAALRPRRLLISARPGQEIPAVPPDVHVVRDAFGECGPLGGLVSALREIELDGPGGQLIVLSVDTPSVPAEFLQDMCFEAPPAKGFVAKRDGYWEPLIALYPLAAYPIGRWLIGRKSYSLQAFCTELAARGLIEEMSLRGMPSDIFANINTPEDAIAHGLV